MVEKISVQIALEGGKEVERQLVGIGEAGQKAFDQVAKSAEQVGGFKNLKPEEVTAKLKSLGIEGTKAFDQIQQAVSKAVKFETLVQGVQGVETALVALGRAAGPVGLAIAAGLAAAAKATIRFAEEVGKIGEQIKFDQVTQAFKELQDAATRGFGAQGTRQLAELQKAAEGTGKAAELARQKLVELGLVQAPDVAKKFNEIQASLEGLSRVDAATKVQQALLAIADPATRAAVAVKLFGDAVGTKLAADLQKGGASAATFSTIFSNLITPEDVSKADALNQSITRLTDTWNRFGSLTLAPTLAQGIDVITAAVTRLNTTLQTLDWSALGAGARFALSPIGTMTELIQAQFQQMGQAGQQAGQQAAQGLQLVRNPLTGMPELVNATNQALSQTGQAAQEAGQQGAQGFQVWNEELGKAVPASQAAATGASSAFQTITTAILGAGAAVSNFVSTLATITWDAISSAGVAAWNAITGAIQGAIDKIREFLGLKSQSGGGGGGGAQGKARGGLIGGRGSGTSDSNLAWVSRGEHIMPAHVVRQPGVLAFLEMLRRGGNLPGFADGGQVGGGGLGIAGQFIQALGTAIGKPKSIYDQLRQGMEGVFRTLTQVQKSILQGATQASNSITQAMQQTSQVLQTTLNSLQQLQIDLAKILAELIEASKREAAQKGKARGGLIGGRGTGTSDSNLAWLSRGEYVTPARAVAQPGVLAFLEALRRSGGNLRGVLDGMGRFALGGLVPRPAYATGGSVGSMSHVTINFPGTPPITGLRASAAAVDELRKAAALAQVRSGGRKPSRYT